MLTVDEMNYFSAYFLTFISPLAMQESMFDFEFEDFYNVGKRLS